MPVTRRSTGNTRGRTGPTKGQSTISFTNKVTKSVPRDTKTEVVSPSVNEINLPQHKKPIEEEKVAEKVPDELEFESAEEEDQEQLVLSEVNEVPEKSETELRAEKISDAQINKYWKTAEKQRIAPRVHQQGLQQSEKILRYFDVSSQYGVSPSKSHVYTTMPIRPGYTARKLTSIAMHRNSSNEAMV